MNLKLTFHLLKIEWLRLKTPIIILWLLVLLTSAPWLLHDPHGLEAPGRWPSGELYPLNPPTKISGADFLQRFLIFYGYTAAMLLALGISAATSLRVKSLSHALTIRIRELILSKALLIFLALALPQAAIAAITLAVQGFSADEIAPAVMELLVGEFTKLTAFSILASWCGSFWYLITSVFCLIQLDVIQSLLPRFLFSGSGFINLASSLSSNFNALTLLVLALAFPWIHPKLGNIARMIVALIIIWGVGLAAPKVDLDNALSTTLKALLPSTSKKEKPQAEIDVSKIHPILRDTKIKQRSFSILTRSGPLDSLIVKANFETNGCPSGYRVLWLPLGEKELKSGSKVISHTPPLSINFNSYFSMLMFSGGYFNVQVELEESMAEMLAATFPKNTQILNSSPMIHSEYRAGDTEFNFPFGKVLSHEKVSQSSITSMSAGVVGSVYQWRKMADEEINKATIIRSKDEPIRWLCHMDGGPNRGDLTVTLASFSVEQSSSISQLGRRQDLDHRFFLYLPASGLVIKLQEPGANGFTPIYQGGSWVKSISRINRQELPLLGKDLNMDGARILIFRADVAGLTPEIKVRIPLSTEKSNTEPDEFARWNSDMNGLKEKSYTDPALSGPPDPETGNETEFSRWLRSPSPTIGYRSAIDLRCYTNRFSSLLVSIAGNKPKATELSLSMGMHESQIETVIENIKTAHDPQIWANVARNRGWTARAKDALVTRLKEGSLKDLSAVMSLEDPALYPALIEQLVLHPDLSTYEKLRLLPGIEPLLSKSITHAARQADLNALKSKAAKHDFSYGIYVDYGPYLIDAKQGNAESLLAIWNIQACLNAKDRYLSSILQMEDVVRFSGKTPEIETLTAMRDEDFQYDPLLRRWSLK